MLTDLGLSYAEALHGVQSAIKYKISSDDGRTADPKHLRVGIDSAHSSILALSTLLLEKGVFTHDEYIERVRLAMNHELAMYEQAFYPLTFR